MASWPLALGLILTLAAVQSALLLRELTLVGWLVYTAFGGAYFLLGWTFGRERRTR